MTNNHRHLFSLPDDITYLNCAYMSPLLKSVEEAGIEGIRVKRNPSVLTPDDFFEPIKRIHRLFASLLNIDNPGRVAIAPSVSYGLANVANNIKLKRGENVIVVKDQFPSNYYVWNNICQTANAELRITSLQAEVENPNVSWSDKVLQAIDTRTKLIALPHVHWADGTIFDLEAIRSVAHKAGAILVVDGTQSFGAFPFDQSIIQADALVCSAYKWLMGPYGIALCYYGETFDRGEPIEHSWMNRLKSDDFARLVEYQDDFRPGAKRYEVGESSNFIHLPMVETALNQVIEWTPDYIQSHCKKISEDALSTLSANGFGIGCNDNRAHHLFGIRLPDHADINKARSAIHEAKIFTSIRGNAIRVSPHCYNTEDDLAHLVSVLTSLVGR